MSDEHDKCALPTCGRTLTEGSGREPHEYDDHRFCDIRCAQRWSLDELPKAREEARKAEQFRLGLRRILINTAPSTRGYAIAVAALGTGTRS